MQDRLEDRRMDVYNSYHKYERGFVDETRVKQHLALFIHMSWKRSVNYKYARNELAL